MASKELTASSKSFRANGLATLIGSIPLADHAEALDLIFRYTPRIPLWPQLPGIPQEGMLVQFNEGLAGIDTEGERTFFNTAAPDFAEEQLAFYEEYLQVVEDLELLPGSRFAVSRSHAEGLYQLVEKVGGQPGVVAVKGQITGPFTLLTGLSDQDNRAGYYDPALREMMVKGLAMKAAWQVTMLGSTGLPAILFIDEPALAGLGSSSFISISREDIAQDQTEMIEAIHTAGGLAGVHVCANTDWPLLLSLDYDILNFDAYEYFDRLVSSRREVYGFLERGGIVAWGIIPTSREESIREETTESLVARWEEQAGQLSDGKWDLPALLGQSLITPSCGTGTLSAELATRVLHLTRDVSESLREKYLK